MAQYGIDSIKELIMYDDDPFCSVCKIQFEALIVVEDLDFDKLCFYCYRNRFGLERFSRKLKDMTPTAQDKGWIRVYNVE